MWIRYGAKFSFPEDYSDEEYYFYEENIKGRTPEDYYESAKEWAWGTESGRALSYLIGRGIYVSVTFMEELPENIKAQKISHYKIQLESSKNMLRVLGVTDE